MTEIREQLTDAVVMPPKIKMENLSHEAAVRSVCVSLLMAILPEWWGEYGLLKGP